jgi:hypothetical protein
MQKLMNSKNVLTCLFLISSIAAYAQKLPAVQQLSVRAPANIKIDGKATEWNNKFQANNKATDVYYTLSNDDKNLYLTVQAIFPDVIKRILNGGITFIVNPSGKKTDPDAKSITYPAYNNTSPVVVNFKNKPEIIPGLPATVMEADSFMKVNNKKLNDRVKFIRTAGIKDVDTLVSVYNEDGIKAAALFDNQMVYTCEFSIALKHFGLSTGNTQKFAYHVVINQVTQHGIEIKRSQTGEIMSINITAGAQTEQAATDFWGEYTLAK